MYKSPMLDLVSDHNISNRLDQELAAYRLDPACKEVWIWPVVACRIYSTQQLALTPSPSLPCTMLLIPSIMPLSAALMPVKTASAYSHCQIHPSSLMFQTANLQHWKMQVSGGSSRDTMGRNSAAGIGSSQIASTSPLFVKGRQPLG